MIQFLPRLVAALLILLIGWFVGRAIGALVERLTDSVELDRAVATTPVGQILGGTEDAVSNAFGTLAAWFVYAVAVLAAADVLAVAVLSNWIARAVSYLPAFIAGVLVIVIGFVVADFVGDAIERTRASTEAVYRSWFATATRVFLYFTVIVIGLDTMGVDVTILTLFAQALAWGLALAIALGVGIAVGWGGKDYVSDNIDRWMGRARRAGRTSEPQDDTSVQPTD